MRTSRVRRALMVAAALATTALGAGTTGAAVGNAATVIPACPDAELILWYETRERVRSAIECLINQERKKLTFLAPLVHHDALARTSQIVADNAVKTKMSYAEAEAVMAAYPGAPSRSQVYCGSSPCAWVELSEYSHALRASQAVALFLADPADRARLLSAKYTEIGVGADDISVAFPPPDTGVEHVGTAFVITLGKRG